jgi:uncharacterized damage-inducible protein DinB
MTPDARLTIVHLLESSREEVNAAARAIPEGHANARPAAGRWSVLECVEHIAAVEERLLGRLSGAERMETVRADAGREAKLAAMVTDRSVRAQAPDPVAPKGRFTSVAEALDQFNAARTRTVRFAEERGGELYQLAAEHPRFGSLNGMEMLVIIAGHARRHAEQIREIAAAFHRP